MNKTQKTNEVKEAQAVRKTKATQEKRTVQEGQTVQKMQETQEISVQEGKIHPADINSKRIFDNHELPVCAGSCMCRNGKLWLM